MTTPTPDLPDWTRTSAVIDSPQLLYDSGAGAALPINTPTMDVTRFRSVRTLFSSPPSGGVGVAKVLLAWGLPVLGPVYDEYTVWPSNQPGLLDYGAVLFDRVHGDTLQVSAQQYAAGGVGQLVVVGSLADQPARDTLWEGAQSSEVLVGYPASALAAGGTLDFYTGPYAGDLWLTLRTVTASMIAAVYGQFDASGSIVEIPLGQTAPTKSTETTLRVAGGGMALRVHAQNIDTVAGTVSLSLVKAH